MITHLLKRGEVISLFLILSLFKSHREESVKHIAVTKLSSSTMSIELEKPTSLFTYAAAFGVRNEFTPNSTIIVALIISLTSEDWLGKASCPPFIASAIGNPLMTPLPVPPRARPTITIQA